MSKSSSPVIIAGMHRSGTSLVTSVVSASGVDVGDRLVPADRHNRRGYYEDVDVLALNRRMLVEACEEGDGGHPDWGWTESERLDRSGWDAHRDEARALVSRLDAGRDGRWGFKDPRTTLLLDFWHPLLDDPRYLLVYRLPWEVADSMQRLGADVFLRHPEYGLRIWAFYNRHLLDFYRRHRGRAVLASTNALLHRPDLVTETLREKLDLDLDRAALDSLYDASLFASSATGDPLVGLVGATSPDVLDLLEQLDAEADAPATGRWRRPGRLRAPRPEKKPRLAVVIPCRDHGQFLIEAVASVERAVEGPCELIIVDDGSTQPRTVEVLDVLDAAGYRVLRTGGIGLSAARNQGIGEAAAEFVLPLDADNRLRPGFVADALAVLDADPEVGAVYGDPWEFGLRQGRRKVAAFDIDKLLEGPYVDACAVMRKATWWDAEGYDEGLRAWEDWDFWIRVGKRGWLVHKLDRLAFDYRVRPHSLVTVTEQPEVLEAIVERVTSKHRQLFDGYLTRRVGHALAAWPRALDRRRRRVEEAAEALRREHDALAKRFGKLEEKTRELESAHAAVSLELERARVERLEAERVADRGYWNREHELQEAKAQALRLELRLEAERRRGDERQAMLDQIHASRAFRLVRGVWRVLASLRRRGARPDAEPPLEDRALGR